MLLLIALLAQDEAVELKWTAAPEDKFDIKWSYEDVSTRVPGTGEKSEVADRRAVEAEMTPKEGEAGRFAVALKKVAWTYSNNEFAITLSWQAQGGKPAQTAIKMKVDPKASNAAAAKSFADARAEQMRKLVEGEYALGFDASSREAFITRNGSAAKNNSLFDTVFLHSPLPNGTVTNGQTWKENLERVTMPQLVEVKMMNCKVSIASGGASVKGGFQQPINRATGGARAETISGGFNFVREFTFSKDGCLLNSKEEQVLTKKVDAKGDGADFYRENSSHSVKQAITFKKSSPPKPKDK